MTTPIHSLQELHEKSSKDPTFVIERAQDFSKKIKAHTQSPDTSVWHSEEVLAHLEKQVSNAVASFDKTRPLYGLFMGVKDLFCTKDLTTTAGSRVLEHYKPPMSASVYEDTTHLGAIMSCKTSMDEFAMGSYTMTSFLGKTSIPGLPDYSAGGSSGGSAAALKAGLCDFSLGSDTGGSVRQPASHCGVVGFKPTYGALSRSGMIAYASSLDQAGFFTRTAKDLSYLLSSGLLKQDKKDMTSIALSVPQSYKSFKSLKIAVFPHLLEHEGLDDCVKTVYQSKIEKYKSLGLEIVEVPEEKLRLLASAAQIYYVLACAEASSCMSRYQGIYFGESLADFISQTALLGQDFWSCVSKYRSEYLGQEVQKRIMLGSYVLSSENFDSIYLTALKAREALTRDIEAILQTADFICLPVSPTPAVRWDEIEKLTSAQTYMADFLTVPFSLARLPALSLPAGQCEVSGAILDVGLQWVASSRADYNLVEFAAQLESLEK